MSATRNAALDIGVAKQIGKYGHAVEVSRHARWDLVSGSLLGGPGVAHGE